MAKSRAILIEYASKQYAAIAFAHMEEVLEAPVSIYVPLAPPHCNTVVEWRGDWIPLFDLNAWCGSPEVEKKHFCVVVSYRQDRDDRQHYGGLRSITFPHIAEVDDSAAAPLPDPQWRGFAKACFRNGERVIPVLDLAVLFETPSKQNALLTRSDIPAHISEENLGKY